MNRKALDELNSTILKEYCKTKNAVGPVQSGFFNGNICMFITQNAENEKLFDEFKFELFSEEEYLKMFQQKDCDFSKFLKEIYPQEYWDDISWTSIYKTNFKDYKVDVDEKQQEWFMNILKQQIKIINPKIIVCIGDVSKQICEKNGIKVDLCIPHWSYLIRIGLYTKKMREYCAQIEDLVYKYYVTQCTSIENEIIVRYDFFGRKTKRMLFDSYFYVKNDEGKFLSYDGIKLSKVLTKDCNGIYFDDTWEKDVYYNIRWLIDNDARFVKKQKIGYFDIETDKSLDIFGTDKPVISVALVTGNKKYCWGWRGDLKQEEVLKNNVEYKSFSNEYDMLKDFFKFLKTEAFDVLVGWNSDRFDWPYLLNRAKNNFNIYLNELSPLDRVNFNLGDNKDSLRLRIYGTDIIDLLKVYKKITYDKKPSIFSLENIAQITLGEGKKDVGNISYAWRNNIELLLEYNVHDCDLVKRIDETNRLTDYMMTLQEISSCPLDLCLWNKNVVDTYLLKEYHNKQIFPTAKNNEREDIVGAITGKIIFDKNGGFKSVNPDKGLFKNVGVLDFSSMYPSLFRTFNVSPDTIQFDGDILINGTKFDSNKIGLIPNVFEELLKKRRYYENIRDSFDRDSNEWYVYQNYQGGVKQIANSFYGITGYPKFRLYNPVITRTITFLGQELIAFAAKKTEELGYEVIYTDTDSLFVVFDGKNEEEIVNQSELLSMKLNECFKEFVLCFKKDDSHCLKIECEKIFSKLIMIGVKKKYIGKLFFKKGKMVNEVFYRGIELVKRDTPKVFKVFLKDILERLLEEDDSLLKSIKDFKQEVKKVVDAREIVIYKNISKNIEKYNTLPQHIKAAKFSNENLDKNFDKGDTIGLIYVKNKGIDCIGLEDNDEVVPKEFVVDWDKYFEMFVDRKLEAFNFLPQLKVQHTIFDFIEVKK